MNSRITVPMKAAHRSPAIFSDEGRRRIVHQVWDWEVAFRRLPPSRLPGEAKDTGVP